MKVLKMVFAAELTGLALLGLAFFRLSALPELAASYQPFIAAAILPESSSSPTIDDQPKDNPWTMIAVGDIMLDRYVRTTLQTKGSEYPFSLITPALANHEVVLGNLEGPFTSQTSVATDTHLVFTFDPAIAPTLSNVGFTDLSLANNHTLNFGQAGLEQTRRVLQSAGLHYFGDPNNRQGFSLMRQVAGRKIAFIGYNALSKNLATVIGEINETRTRADVVIIMVHWGSEYQLRFNARQQSEAHQLIDAGADMIIGTHPHVVQPFEIYNNKFIAYSLGNFLFDQYFSTDTLEGLMLRLTFSSDGLAAILVPVVTERGQIHLLSGPLRDSLLSRLAADSAVPETMRPDIRLGRFILPNINKDHLP